MWRTEVVILIAGELDEKCKSALEMEVKCGVQIGYVIPIVWLIVFIYVSDVVCYVASRFRHI